MYTNSLLNPNIQINIIFRKISPQANPPPCPNDFARPIHMSMRNTSEAIANTNNKTAQTPINATFMSGSP